MNAFINRGHINNLKSIKLTEQQPYCLPKLYEKIKTILYIDDDEDDCSIFESALTSFNERYNLTYVHSAIEALKLLKLGKVSPDLIFVDLNMPRLNGFEFLQEVKKIRGFSIPVVVISTSRNETDIARAMELGARGYIPKPDTYSLLCDILRQVLTVKEKR